MHLVAIANRGVCVVIAALTPTLCGYQLPHYITVQAQPQVAPAVPTHLIPATDAAELGTEVTEAHSLSRLEWTRLGDTDIATEWRIEHGHRVVIMWTRPLVDNPLNLAFGLRAK